MINDDLERLKRRIERAEDDGDDEDGPDTFAEAIKKVYHEEPDT